MSASSEIDEVAADVARYPEVAVRHAVDRFRRQITPRLRLDTGGDSRLSGLNNARLNVSTKVTGQILAEGTVTAGPKRMRGPWRWLEDGTRPRTTATGREHPGTAGKQTWSDPVRTAMPDVQAGIARDFDAVVR